MEKIRKFTDLIAWQESHKLVIMVYRSIENFPKSEMFGLANQIRRCVVSIASNIAEGFGRKTFKDKNQFYNVAIGSVTELQCQLLIARDLEYISREKFDEIARQTISVHKLINSLIKGNKIKMQEEGRSNQDR